MYPGTTWLTPETSIQRDLAILRTLAHVTWLTTEQVHALCFPGMGVATVRMALRALEEAGWIWHVRWRIKKSSGSHIWTITTKGLRILVHYSPDIVPQRLCDLTRPSTALEDAEWRIGLAVRTLTTRLILEARQTAVLAQLTVLLPDPWSTGCAANTISLSPDVVLSIHWTPPIAHAAAWLPWGVGLEQRGHAPAKHYALYFDRANWIHLVGDQQLVQPSVRIVPLHAVGQQGATAIPDQLQEAGHVYPWPLLEQGVSHLLQHIPVTGSDM